VWRVFRITADERHASAAKKNENWYACLGIKKIDDLLDAPESPVMPKNPPTQRVNIRTGKKDYPENSSLLPPPAVIHLTYQFNSRPPTHSSQKPLKPSWIVEPLDVSWEGFC
jgi:hypothetical protein